MNHRKVNPQVANVPFSWEASPGVSKVTVNLPPTALLSPSDCHCNTPNLSANDIIKIPLPPSRAQTPLKSISSGKGIWQPYQEDPFAAALRECTKKVEKGNSLALKLRKYKGICSCKKSCDAVENNLVRISNFYPLPKQRSSGCPIKPRE